MSLQHFHMPAFVAARSGSLIMLMLLLSPVASHAGDFFSGEAIYTSYCSGCHGASGQGEMPGAPNFTHGQTLMQPDLRLYGRIRDGINAMPGFRGVLSETEILDVISYIRKFH